MYVARFTSTPERDVERGWSGYMGEFETDLETALDNAGHLDYEKGKVDLDEKQQRWIFSYGERYEDWDVFYQEWLVELAEKYNLRQDPHTGAWRPFHHDGLSCWALEAQTMNDAIVEAQTAAIDWSGFGQATVGEITLVGKVPACGDALKDEYLYIFECEDTISEGAFG